MEPRNGMRVAMAAALLAAVASEARTTGAVPILELSDADLAIIDLQDRGANDWREVLGSPTLTARECVAFNGTFDPADLDFAVWLAWHDATNRLYCAVERADDVYLNRFAPVAQNRWFAMWFEDSSVWLNVDGDASGGQYQYGGEVDSEAERRLLSNRHAQMWLAIADTYDDGRRVDLLENGFRYLQSWFVEPPYASGGGGSFSERPFLSVTEFYVTPFDELVWDDPLATKVTDLRPNGRITFQLTVPDYDEPDERNGLWLGFPTTGGVMSDTERHADGWLVPKGTKAQEDGVASRALSWAAVKRQVVADTAQVAPTSVKR